MSFYPYANDLNEIEDLTDWGAMHEDSDLDAQYEDRFGQPDDDFDPEPDIYDDFPMSLEYDGLYGNYEYMEAYDTEPDW